MGVIKFDEVFLFCFVLGIVAFMVSKIICEKMRKRNRFSYVLGALFLCQSIVIVYLPLYMLSEYWKSGFSFQKIFGFGSLC